MNRLIEHAIERVLRVKAKTLTDTQEAGSACVVCGREFLTPADRAPWACLGVSWRHRHYACTGACFIEVVDDVTHLFSSTVPHGRPVWLYRLGIDDTPLITAPDGSDMVDEAHLAAHDAQPKQAVTILHGRGAINTRPLPADYARRIAEQAMRLGYTAMINEGSGLR
jgi:hypothetical protein